MLEGIKLIPESVDNLAFRIVCGCVCMVLAIIMGFLPSKHTKFKLMSAAFTTGCIVGGICIYKIKIVQEYIQEEYYMLFTAIGCGLLVCGVVMYFWRLAPVVLAAGASYAFGAHVLTLISICSGDELWVMDYQVQILSAFSIIVAIIALFIQDLVLKIAAPIIAGFLSALGVDFFTKTLLGSFREFVFAFLKHGLRSGASAAVINAHPELLNSIPRIIAVAVFSITTGTSIIWQLCRSECGQMEIQTSHNDKHSERSQKKHDLESGTSKSIKKKGRN